MAVPCTPAVAAEVREEHERKTRERRPWVRVRLRQRASDFMNVPCRYCEGMWGPIGPGPAAFAPMARCHFLVEGWLVVEIYVGECRRCGTIYWG